MRPLIVIVFLLTSCCTPKHVRKTPSPPRYSLVESVDDGGYRFEIWLRPDGTSYVRLQLSDGRIIRLPINHYQDYNYP